MSTPQLTKRDESKKEVKTETTTTTTAKPTVRGQQAKPTGWAAWADLEDDCDDSCETCTKVELKSAFSDAKDVKVTAPLQLDQKVMDERLRKQLVTLTTLGGKKARKKGGQGGGWANPNKVYDIIVSDAVGITANGSGNTIGSQGLDPSGWTSFSVYQDMFAKYRIIKAEYRIVTAGANVATVPQSLVIAWDPGATSVTPGSQAVLWQFPKAKVFQLATASGVAKDGRTFDYVTRVQPDQEWYDMITPAVQRGCLGYYGDGATASVAAWTLYIKYHVQFSGLVTP